MYDVRILFRGRGLWNSLRAAFDFWTFVFRSTFHLPIHHPMRILQDVLWTCTLVADALLSLRICPVVAFWLLEPVNPKKAASEKVRRV